MIDKRRAGNGFNTYFKPYRRKLSWVVSLAPVFGIIYGCLMQETGNSELELSDTLGETFLTNDKSDYYSRAFTHKPSFSSPALPSYISRSTIRELICFILALLPSI
jgi:hypothetical protein